MKTKITFFLLVLIYMAQQDASAQVWMGIYGMRTNSSGTISNTDLGGGFGMSFLSDARDISALKRPVEVNLLNNNLAKSIGDHSNALQLQVGGNFFYTGLGQRNFYSVPLTSAAGIAKVNLSNGMWGINAMGRLSYKNPSIFTPYVDVYTGYRGMYSDATITPYVQQPNKAIDTRQPLTSLSGLNYAIGGGIMTSLTKNIRLDLGLTYSEAYQSGHMADIANATSDPAGINLNFKNAPNGFMMVNFGIMFYIRGGYGDDDDCPCREKNSGSAGTTYRSSGTRWGSGSGWGSSGGGGRSSVGIHVGGDGGFGGVRIK